MDEQINYEKLIEIDEKQSFLHKNPIDICSKVSFANDSQITFETSRIGHLSESAIIVNCKGTIVLTTACSKLQNELKFEDNLDLKVDAHERSWSRGYIPSGVQRNDGGITDYEILLCRMIDRSIRPLFISSDLSNTVMPAFEVQILSNLLSCDDIYDSEVLAINGASASIFCSDKLHKKYVSEPIGAVRCIVDENDLMICNPTKQQIEAANTKCNLLYVGTSNNCVMIETNAKFIDDKQYGKLLQFAQKNVSKITEAIKELRQKKSKIATNDFEFDEEIIAKYEKLSEYKPKLMNDDDIVQQTKNEIFALYSNQNIDKNDRNYKRDVMKKQFIKDLNAQYPNGFDQEFIDDEESMLSISEWSNFYKALFVELDTNAFREAYVTNNRRCDGRGFDELRALNHDIDILPSCHGSSLFERGNTQSLCSATLGPPKLARMRNMHKAGHPEQAQRLYFQYEMPPFATNEIKAIQSKNRRAIGHANIALNALTPLLPSFDEFPFSVRVYSNITASDGSSSMASVCGGSLALMDAGVPMKEPAAGISIGLIADNILLTDIAGIEDHFGLMDFKIAGTRNGINSVQLDIKKNNGIPLEIMLKAIEQSKRARIQILDSMKQCIAESKKELKAHSPRVEIVSVPFRDLPRVIGSGGAVKKQIQIQTGCDVEILWEAECVEVTAPNQMLLNKAKQAIADVIGSQCRIGDIVSAKIINIQSYGVMMRIDDGSEHLVHISQWDQNDQIEYATDQSVEIMCIGFLGENRPNFSRKAAIWQLSDDPEDRARLRLMLDSLRPPARSRAMAGQQSSVSAQQTDSEQPFFQQREPLSIFSDNLMDGDEDNGMEGVTFQQQSEQEMDVDEDGINLGRKLMGDPNEERNDNEQEEEEEEEDDDDDTTHPTILPPPPTKPDQFEKNNKESIQNLIDSISSSSTSKERIFGVNGSGQSRFANLYKGIHSEKDKKDADEPRGRSSKFGDLMNSIRGSKESANVNKDTIEHKKGIVDTLDGWKSFTKDLMSSNGKSDSNEKDNDINEDDDDLLNDLFGERSAKKEPMTSRASALMDSIPDFNDDDGKKDVNDDSDKWPWQQDAM